MNDVLISLEVAVGIAVLLAVVIGLLVARRRFLSRATGTFECSLRTTTQRLGKGWALGVARYEADRIEWFRTFDVSPRPRHVLQRGNLQVQQRRYPTGPEVYAVMTGSVVVRCSYDRRPLELAMSEQAYTGFASWLEAAPPGQNVSLA